jgi:hypothetical protein
MAASLCKASTVRWPPCPGFGKMPLADNTLPSVSHVVMHQQALAAVQGGPSENMFRRQEKTLSFDLQVMCEDTSLLSSSLALGKQNAHCRAGRLSRHPPSTAFSAQLSVAHVSSPLVLSSCHRGLLDRTMITARRVLGIGSAPEICGLSRKKAAEAWNAQNRRMHFLRYAARQSAIVPNTLTSLSSCSQHFVLPRQPSQHLLWHQRQHQ